MLTVLRSLSLSFFSPFEVVVGREAGPQLIRAWGPGLEGGIVGKPAIFVVESVGTDVGVLGESLISLFPNQVYFWVLRLIIVFMSHSTSDSSRKLLAKVSLI